MKITRKGKRKPKHDVDKVIFYTKGNYPDKTNTFSELYDESNEDDDQKTKVLKHDKLNSKTRKTDELEIKINSNSVGNHIFLEKVNKNEIMKYSNLHQMKSNN